MNLAVLFIGTQTNRLTALKNTVSLQKFYTYLDLLCKHAVHRLKTNLRMNHKTVNIDVFVRIMQTAIRFIREKGAERHRTTFKGTSVGTATGSVYIRRFPGYFNVSVF